MPATFCSKARKPGTSARASRPVLRACARIAVLLVATFASIATTADRASAGAAISSSSAADLAQVARSLAPGRALRVEGVELDGAAAAAGLDLASFQPVAAGARFVLQTDAGPREARVELPTWLRGTVDGMQGSIAVLSVRASGELRGWISGAGQTWMLERRSSDRAIRSRRVDKNAIDRSRSFDCEVLPNPGPQRTSANAVATSANAVATSANAVTTSANAVAPSARGVGVYTAQIAVELDHDYYRTFAPDAAGAILYALDLMAFTGSLGQSELGMDVQVPFVQMWTTASDPYGAGSGRLGQVRTRWNTPGQLWCGGTDCTTIDRTTVLLLSSANTGGVAYVPGICDSWHDPTNSFSYAYTGSIAGNFDIDNPTSVWDIVATTHELGHNFGSDHTHCYGPPVDNCYGSETGCHAGATSLPFGCPGSGQGCGTIMSYCHLLTGGMGNVALTWGASHPYGTDPGRVPDEMMARLATEASAAPGCLVASGGMSELEVTKAGSGSGAVTSSPAGIDCGTGCRSYFDSGTLVTLSATPNVFSSFSGFSGDPDCADGVVTLVAAASCTATFTGTCGAGNQDCDDENPCTTDSCPADDHCENAGTPRAAGTCYGATTTRLKINNPGDPDSVRMTWQWIAGDAYAQADLGDPTTTNGFDLCIYDSTAGSPSLSSRLALPAGGLLWRSYAPKGWLWSDKQASFDGIKKLQFKAGEQGKSKVKLSAAGELLPLAAAVSGSELFNEDPTLVVQLLASNGRCWTSSFAPAGTSANTPLMFKATGD